MEIQRAANLGVIHQSLGIKPDSRISYQLTDYGFVIWDLATGTEYTIRQGQSKPSVARFELPQNITNIIAASDDDLKQRWIDSWLDGWTDERRTIFTELAYRGISTLGL